ncbi:MULTISPECIES: hypothetical protein [Amycolatopsis]|uniref:Uncharacterized protein n=1 Tax=Amycolatopsis rubida TaxID=112413 RepID=A0A1I5QDZ6_9PSEU|nr:MULTISPECIES: hypothetical protein [Amycolatopsis]OAP26513.1 hypothetical protein A4R44_02500 [Amycolatopsis sp. M39]SFP44508.1 hypothetical protein SAMN05421854_105285 [Amycolatopsis rubida]
MAATAVHDAAGFPHPGNRERPPRFGLQPTFSAAASGLGLGLG